MNGSKQRRENTRVEILTDALRKICRLAMDTPINASNAGLSEVMAAASKALELSDLLDDGPDDGAEARDVDGPAAPAGLHEVPRKVELRAIKAPDGNATGWRWAKYNVSYESGDSMTVDNGLMGPMGIKTVLKKRADGLLISPSGQLWEVREL